MRVKLTIQRVRVAIEFMGAHEETVAVGELFAVHLRVFNRTIKSAANNTEGFGCRNLRALAGLF